VTPVDSTQIAVKNRAERGRVRRFRRIMVR
jgi:hypothetical protein